MTKPNILKYAHLFNFMKKVNDELVFIIDFICKSSKLEELHISFGSVAKFVLFEYKHKLNSKIDSQFLYDMHDICVRIINLIRIELHKVNNKNIIVIQHIELLNLLAEQFTTFIIKHSETVDDLVSLPDKTLEQLFAKYSYKTRRRFYVKE